jgi:hypothetical protein
MMAHPSDQSSWELAEAGCPMVILQTRSSSLLFSLPIDATCFARVLLQVFVAAPGSTAPGRGASPPPSSRLVRASGRRRMSGVT